jgi:hypothetical protein
MLIIYILLPESPAWCASRNKEEKAKKNMRLIYRGVEEYDVDAQYEILAQTIAHEKQVAENSNQVKWHSIFRGVNGVSGKKRNKALVLTFQRRTMVSTWALTSQQVLGLTLFYTYAAYFFKTAGIADPFAVTCITNGIQLVIILIVAASVDRFGRRNIACGGLTTMLVAVTLIGILGVVPQSKASNGLLVFFSCIFSKFAQSPKDPAYRSSRRSTVLRFDWMGFRRRDLFSAPQTLYCWFCRRHLVRRWSHHERVGALHAQREPMGEFYEYRK